MESINLTTEDQYLSQPLKDARMEYFNLARGVRQGDPFSPYLFLLDVETLTTAIRENEEIKGFVINKRPNYHNMLMIQWWFF